MQDINAARAHFLVSFSVKNGNDFEPSCEIKKKIRLSQIFFLILRNFPAQPENFLKLRKLICKTKIF